MHHLVRQGLKKISNRGSAYSYFRRIRANMPTCQYLPKPQNWRTTRIRGGSEIAAWQRSGSRIGFLQPNAPIPSRVNANTAASMVGPRSMTVGVNRKVRHR